MKLALAVLVVAACSSRPPDFEAYCEKAAPCENKPVSSCIADSRRRWQEQKKRGCASEGRDLVECEIKYGRCESSGSLSVFMPTDDCLKQLHAFEDCLTKNR